MTQTLTEAKDELARILGVTDIQTENPRWLALMREGVVVKLHIRRWRAKASLDLEDLGLPSDAEDQVGDLLTLGDKRLLPVDLGKRLEAKESAGRKCLERSAYATYYGPFLPASRFRSWLDEDREHERGYLAIRDEITERYDDILIELLNAYRGAARAAYRRAMALTPERMTRAEMADEFWFVECFTKKIERLIPTRQQIHDSFAWEREYTYIPLPSLLAEDQAEADRTRERRRIEEMTEQMQNDDLWKTIAIKDEADRQRRQMLDQMNQQVTQEARQKKEQIIDGFLRDVVVQLRTTVYEAATDIAAAMTKNDGKLHPRSVVQLRSLIDRVGELNFFGDAETTRMITQVQGLFDRPATTRNQADIKTTLQDVALVTRQSLIDLDAAGAARSARIIGDSPITEEIIVAARKRLNLDDTDPTADLITATRQRGAI